MDDQGTRQQKGGAMKAGAKHQLGLLVPLIALVLPPVAEARQRLSSAPLETLAEIEALSSQQLKALEVRRALLVKHFDAHIARKGEAAVLYDLPPRR